MFRRIRLKVSQYAVAFIVEPWGMKSAFPVPEKKVEFWFSVNAYRLIEVIVDSIQGCVGNPLSSPVTIQHSNSRPFVRRKL